MSANAVKKDHYSVLGVTPASEDVVIRAAYHALMRRYHLDADPSDEAAERARAVNVAYAVLRDPAKRARYDEPLGARDLKFAPGAHPERSRPIRSRLAPAAAIGVCGNTNLASLDRQLSLLYRQSWNQADEKRRAALLGTRQRFNERRDACVSPNCMTTAYLSRLKEISDIMAGRKLQ